MDGHNEDDDLENDKDLTLVAKAKMMRITLDVNNKGNNNNNIAGSKDDDDSNKY